MAKKEAAPVTNALRLVAAAGLPHETHAYECDGPLDGVTVAGIIGEAVETVFKTLVTRGASGEIYVFVVPVAEELSLKKAAGVTGEKYIEMIHVSEITPLTGYVRGGCSPVGMKKHYRTVIDETATIIEKMTVSAGRLGLQMTLAPDDLAALVSAEFADITAQ